MAETGASQTVAHVLGEITWLLSQTPHYKNLRIADLESMVMPAVLLKQFRIFYNDGEKRQPVAFAVWAYLSDEADKQCLERLQSGVPFVLPVKDWKSGENIWLLELVSPFATPANGLLSHLRENLAGSIFKGKPYRYCGTDQKTGAKTLEELTPGEMGQA